MTKLSTETERLIERVKFEMERKTCTLELRENNRGPLLRIVEQRPDGNWQKMVILPATEESLANLIENLQLIQQAALAAVGQRG